jgi:2-hydroxychromene-2-carboxylate isomerase
VNEIATIDFYYSILMLRGFSSRRFCGGKRFANANANGSRYSYLASSQIGALARETGCHIEWHPINSVRLIAQGNHNPFEGKPIFSQYEWTYRELDAQRWANLYKIPYIEPRGRVNFDSELLARSCTAAKRLGKVEEYSRLLLAAMFQDSLSKIDERECIARAERCGISASDFQIALREEETLDRLNITINNALDRGVFGVPTFIALGELFWGNDRIILLREYLTSVRNLRS